MHQTRLVSGIQRPNCIRVLYLLTKKRMAFQKVLRCINVKMSTYENYRWEQRLHSPCGTARSSMSSFLDVNVKRLSKWRSSHQSLCMRKRRRVFERLSSSDSRMSCPLREFLIAVVANACLYIHTRRPDAPVRGNAIRVEPIGLLIILAPVICASYLCVFYLHK